MKYRCPTCGEVFEGQLAVCPKCGRPMKYKQPEPKKEEVKEQAPANQVVAVNNNPVATVSSESKSSFDGKLIQLIGWVLLGELLTIVTLGICFPIALCMVYKWERNHTVIDGRRLVFVGKGGQLVGKWILWMLLTIVTLGIFSLWIPMKLERWLVERTHFEA